MTSNQFDPGAPPPEDSCPFCAIASTYPPYDPRQCPPRSTSTSATVSSPSPSPSFSVTSTTTSTTQPGPLLSAALSPTRLTPPAYVALSTPLLIAFLDIQPLSRGHLLLCPRAHRAKLTDATDCEAAALGRYLRVLSEALARATGVRDWNVVQNNGAAAAQVVPHCHFHLIPRPDIRAKGKYAESFTMFGRGRREELDEEDAEGLVALLRECVAAVLMEEERSRL